MVATRHGEGPAVQTHPEGTEDLRGRARCRRSGIGAARTRGTHSRRQTAGATAPHYHRAVRGAWRPCPPTRCDTRRRRLPPTQSEAIDDDAGFLRPRGVADPFHAPTAVLPAYRLDPDRARVQSPPETGVRSRRLLGPTARPREFPGAVASSTAFLSPAAWPSHGPQERRRQPAGVKRQRLHAVGAVRRGTRHRSPWRQAASSVRARRTLRGPRHSRRHHVRR